MPYRDAQDRREHQREYRQRHTSGRGPGRPPLEDRKIHLSLRVRSSLVGRLQRLLLEGLAQGTYPWKTQSHQVEDLLIRGLESLKQHESVDEALQYLRAVAHSESIGRHRKEAQSAYSVVNIELKELKAIGATDQAVHQFWATYQAFAEMSPHTWRDWFLNKMREDHADLYNKKPEDIAFDDTEPESRATRRGSKVVALKRHAR